MANGLTTIPRIDIKSEMEGRKGESLRDFLITIEIREESLISLKWNRTVERGRLHEDLWQRHLISIFNPFSQPESNFNL